MSELQNLIRACEVRSSPFLGSNSILKAICKVQPRVCCKPIRESLVFFLGFEIFEPRAVRKCM